MTLNPYTIVNRMTFAVRKFNDLKSLTWVLIDRLKRSLSAVSTGFTDANRILLNCTSKTDYVKFLTISLDNCVWFELGWIKPIVGLCKQDESDSRFRWYRFYPDEYLKVHSGEYSRTQRKSVWITGCKICCNALNRKYIIPVKEKWTANFKTGRMYILLYNTCVVMCNII